MDIQHEEIIGKDLSLLLWYIDEEMEERAALVNGTAEIVGGRVRLRRPGSLSPIPLPRRMLRKIKRVPEDMRDIFRHAGYFLHCTVRDLPFKKSQKVYHIPDLFG